ncbi:MAG TPA: FtsX-like permease family protein [Thermoplasmata archaeon]|nr:FtsX-like permease family protein [Thermoplasmata archaeon]
MALIRYAAINVIRSRRRTITAMIGVLLAVTFVSGTFIAIDSSTRATLDAFLANLPSDINLEARASANGTQLRQAVEGISGVLRVAVTRFTSIGKLESAAASGPVDALVIGVEPNRLPSALEAITLASGSLSLPRGQAALSDDLAARLNVSTGATVSLRLASYDPTNQTGPRVNVTIAAVFGGVRPGGGPVFPPLAVVHVEDAAWYEEQLGYAYAGNGLCSLINFPCLTGEIRIDRAQVLDPYNIEASRGKLAVLERQINTVLGTFGGHISSDNIPDALSSFESALIIQRIFYLGLSTPVLLLGIYLGAIGIDLSHAERRRELAVLKTRGASRDQTLGLLVLEAAFGGVIAALIGLVAGVGLSRLLLSFVSLFSTASAPQYELVVLSPATVATVAGLSVLFMAATSYRSAKRTADLPIVETLRYYAPGETHLRYRSSWDVLLVTLAVATYGMVLYSRANPGDFVTFLIGPLFIVLLPLAPILLMVGSGRLLTRSTSRVYEAASRVNRPFAKNLHHVITRNLQRNPRRAANVAVIVALGLGFGMFTLVTFSSQFAYQEGQLRAGIGADIAVDAAPSDPGFAASVRALPEVAGLTVVQRVIVPPQFGSAALFALDPGTYLSIAKPEPWYFRDFDSAAVQQVLESPGEVLVTEGYLHSAFLEVGANVSFLRSMRNETGFLKWANVTATIGGTVRGLPGTSVVGNGVPLAIYGSYDTLGPLIDLAKSQNIDPERYLVDLHPGADWRTAEEGIRGLGAGGIRVEAEEVEQLRSVPLFRAFFGFMELEIAFVVVILTAGLALILYAASLEREVELASIRARGASGWQTAGLLVGEASSIMLVGLVVGAGIGVLSAYLSTTFGASGAGESLVPLFLIVPVTSLLLLAAAPIAMLITSFLVSLRVVRMDIGRVLKLRGG